MSSVLVILLCTSMYLKTTRAQGLLGLPSLRASRVYKACPPKEEALFKGLLSARVYKAGPL